MKKRQLLMRQLKRLREWSTDLTTEQLDLMQRVFRKYNQLPIDIRAQLTINTPIEIMQLIDEGQYDKAREALKLLTFLKRFR
jgi:hypothetical protein